MIKRTISVGKPARIYLRQKQMMLDFDGVNTASVPIEDIGVLVLDDPQITVTQQVISRLIENNGAILWSNSSHLPIGLILPLAQNSLFTEKLGSQINATNPLKKKIWKQLVVAKVNNQGRLLEKIGIKGKILFGLAKEVKSGDSSNIEAIAAKYYWKFLFNEIEGFVRGRYEQPPNNLLNYGYAVLRAIVARALVASGCLPALGVHHRNKYNPFCLADDVMEPYRPWVDWIVISMIRETGELPFELAKEHKAELLKVPTLDVMIGGKLGPLMHAVQRTTSSLMKCYEGEEKVILTPEL